MWARWLGQLGGATEVEGWLMFEVQEILILSWVM